MFAPRGHACFCVKDDFSQKVVNMNLQMTGILMEREAKITQSLFTMGMLRSAYWLSWIAWETIMSLVVTLITIAFGAIVQLDFFLKNSFGLTFFALLLFQLAMLGFAFTLAAFLRKSSVAVFLGIAVFITGWVFQVRHPRSGPTHNTTCWSAPNMQSPGNRLDLANTARLYHGFHRQAVEIVACACACWRIGGTNTHAQKRTRRAVGSYGVAKHCCVALSSTHTALQVVTIFGIPYSEDYYHKWGGILTIIFSALPWCPFAKAMQDLGNATSPDADPKGISWGSRSSYCEVRARRWPCAVCADVCVLAFLPCALALPPCASVHHVIPSLIGKSVAWYLGVALTGSICCRMRMAATWRCRSRLACSSSSSSSTPC